MFFSIRWDLDYVPWDTPDAEEFGHGEPAMILRILEFARQQGVRYQFFASNRVLRAFPSLGDAVIDDGHDLDWLCKHPEEPGLRWDVAQFHFSALGKPPEGIAFRSPPKGICRAPRGIKWTSGGQAEGAAVFPLTLPAARDSLRAGRTFRAWLEECKAAIESCNASDSGISVAIHPQVLSRHDPHLVGVHQLTSLAQSKDLPMMTLRQAYAKLHHRGTPAS